jgi:hypothetical protein
VAPSPSEVVQRFFDAVLERDLVGVSTSFAPDAVASVEGVGALGNGSEEIRRYYVDAFAAYPELRVWLVNRVAVGRVVVDHETVSGYDSPEVSHWIWVYTVEDGLITKMHGFPA